MKNNDHAKQTNSVPEPINIESVSNPDDSSNDDHREGWSGKFEFLMSCITLSVGLGNIWRFPFTAYENGGGVFLIPYIIVLFIIGKPMYYLEALLGQFTNKSSVKLWAVVPAFIGVGIGQAYAVFAVLTYYSSLISLTIYYLIGSFKAELPWSYCRDEWGPNCVDSAPSAEQTNNSLTVLNDTKLQSSSELYYLKTVIHELDTLDDGIGSPSWRLVLTLLAAWIVTYFVIARGIKSLGKASYFLALFPYIVLFILLIRAVTLDGAGDGIIYFLKPKWSELLNVKIWKEAVTQCFFSLSVSFGPIVTFSSHNSFHHNVYRDAMIVTTLDTFTSLLAGVTIFGILGNLAYNLGASDIKDVVRSGTGLAFISYPDAISKFTVVPQLFAVLFFFMLFVLGIGSLSGLQNAIVTVLRDQFKLKKIWVVGAFISILGFGIGIVYVTPGGPWILNLIDYYAGTFVVFFMASIEIIGISWVYGLENWCDDVEFMTNRKVSLYWRICWGFLTPVVLVVIFIYTLIKIEPLSYGEIAYPLSADIAGYVILVIGFAQFPLWAIWYFATHGKGSLMKTISMGMKPNHKWGPSNEAMKSKWKIFKEERTQQRQMTLASSKMGQFWQKFSYTLGCTKS